MNMTPRRERFRALLAGDQCLYPASVFDPLSMRAAEDLGFELAMLAGSTASLTVLGAPDLVVLTLSEFAEQALRICRAGGLPLLVDADHGYGNALNVKRTVEELEIAGVAALTIEDTVLPTPFRAGGTPQFTSIAEGQGKLRAALAGRQDPGLVIVGRTGALATQGLDDTIARVRAYAAAGVDALFLVGLRTRAQLEAIASAVALPLILGPVTGELNDRAYLSSQRVRICLQGHQPFSAAVRAVYETLGALRRGVPPSQIADLASDELMRRLTRDDDYKQLIRQSLQAG
jgi:carboxyvinyl-carboxyphosphonate phosphorylmutase